MDIWPPTWTLPLTGSKQPFCGDNAGGSNLAPAGWPFPAVGGIGTSRRGEGNAYLNFGQVQVELIEVSDQNELGGQRYVMDHVGYTGSDIRACIADCKNRGAGDEPITNRVSQTLLYSDTATTLGSRVHLTQLPRG